MNYFKHYANLINRAKTRTLAPDVYKEQHHIIPSCMGGSDDRSNLVWLTAPEHYVAHLLLVKMYPGNHSLVYAANLMTVGTNRSNNKLYEWVRKKHQAVMKLNTGAKNGSYGRSWYHCPVTLANGKFKTDDVPCNWVKGRTPLKQKACLVCGLPTGNNRKTFCVSHKPKPKSPTENGFKRTLEMNEHMSKLYKQRSTEEHPNHNKRWVNDGRQNIMVPVDQLQEYFRTGWAKGKLKTLDTV